MFRVQLSKIVQDGLRKFTQAKSLKNNSKGKSPFDINVRSVSAMREIDRGYSALEKIVWIFKSFSPNASECI